MCARLWIQRRCSRHACTLRQCAHGHTVVALACAHTSHLPPDLVQPATPRGGLRGAGCSCWLAHFFPARRDTFQLAQRWGPGSGSQAWPTTRWCREHRLRTPELWVPELGMGVWGGGGGAVLWEPRVSVRTGAWARTRVFRGSGLPGNSGCFAFCPHPRERSCPSEWSYRCSPGDQHGRRRAEAGPWRWWPFTRCH